MRLLNSKALELREFIGSKVPRYAILSHTWDEGEVSFQDMMNGNTSNKKGYDKIKRCCEVALSDGFKYAWIDTCCIDKTSSSELSEAINSMYRWYKTAAVCYVILSDVPSDEDYHLQSSAFRTSRWFTRGWTLQELIAPACVVFYGIDWKEIGTKASLRDLISEITQIHIGILSGDKRLNSFSIAQKMSWASQRHTTRTEDLAYCLMGIFNVNMPLLYGEGARSFFRLQEQIIRHSDDESIFAWASSGDGYRCSFFATSPRHFVGSGDIVKSPPDIHLVPFSLTNRGICMHTSLFEHQANGIVEKLVVLNCRRADDTHEMCVFVTGPSKDTGRYSGTRESELRAISEFPRARLKLKSIYMYIDQTASHAQQALAIRAKCFVETRGLRENGIFLQKVNGYPIGYNEGIGMALWEWRLWFNFVGGLRFCNSTGDGFDIIFKSRWDSTAMITATINGPIRDSSEGPLPSDPTAYISSPVQGSDRLRWHDPSNNIWVKVTIRAQHISGPDDEDEGETGDSGKTYKIDIHWDEPGDSRVYQSINLKELAISTGLLKA